MGTGQDVAVAGDNDSRQYEYALDNVFERHEDRHVGDEENIEMATRVYSNLNSESTPDGIQVLSCVSNIPR